LPFFALHGVRSSSEAARFTPLDGVPNAAGASGAVGFTPPDGVAGMGTHASPGAAGTSGGIGAGIGVAYATGRVRWVRPPAGCERPNCV
jgi:hypothetical protein